MRTSDWSSDVCSSDLTTDRVEVLRGGPSPVFSNGQTGATVNFITKRGSAIPEGELRTTVSDNGLYRVDGFYSGPISDDWFFSAGGFYREDDGVRDTQFPANKGGRSEEHTSELQSLMRIPYAVLCLKKQTLLQQI